MSTMVLEGVYKSIVVQALNDYEYEQRKNLLNFEAKGDADMCKRLKEYIEKIHELQSIFKGK